nr:hypothetical protein [uncultured Chryseobacterium sp.]
MAYGTLLIISSIFLSMFIFHKTIYEIPLLILNLGFIYYFVRLKSVIIELSGGCISIRKYHPLTFKSFIHPFIELPQSCIQNYSIKNRFGFGGLMIKVKSKRGKKFILQISLIGFGASQKKKLKTCFQSVDVSNHEDNHIMVVA